MSVDFAAADAAIEQWGHGKGVTNSEWELREVVWEASRIGPIETVLEIGSYAGGSLRIWQDAFKPSICIGVEFEDSDRTNAGLNERAEAGAYIIYGDSTSKDTWVHVKSALQGRQVDFLYIDADHSYETTRRDFGLYAPLLRAGGICVMDDCVSSWNIGVEVYRVVPELMVAHRTKMLSGCANARSDDVAGGKFIVYAPDPLTGVHD